MRLWAATLFLLLAGAGTPDDATIGACVSEIEQMSPDNTVHYRVTQFPEIGNRPFIQVNRTLKYDIVFADDFESGNASRWAASPP